MKQCKTCTEFKPLEQFSNGKNNAGGKVPHCKTCVKANLNKQGQNIRSKRYRDKHPEKRLELNRRYREQNPEKMRKIHTDYGKKRYSTDPVYRLQTILRQQIVDYIKYKKNERTAELLGYTAEDFINRYGTGQVNDHVDHKIPKSWFKENTPINIVWHMDNLHWLPIKENFSKGNRYMTPVSEKYLQIAMPHILESYLPYLTT